MAASKYAAITRFEFSSENPDDQFAVHNPATGDVITTIQGAGVKELNKAVDIAHDTFHNDWRWRSPRERSQLLFKAADRLEAHFDELSSLLSLENGKPVSQAREGDVPVSPHLSSDDLAHDRLVCYCHLPLLCFDYR